MSKAMSYFDWQMTFKNNSLSKKQDNTINEIKKVNSIGLSEEEFKLFLEKWRESNL